MTASFGNDAVIAGDGFIFHDIEHAQFVCQLPHLFLVAPHEWRMDQKLLVHGQVECGVGRQDESIAAVGVTAVVCLRHARHQMTYSLRIGECCCESQKQQVSPWYKSVGIRVGWLFPVHLHGVVGK